jgi:C4-dicarboxylate-specific signal transduction histidine kinase
MKQTTAELTQLNEQLQREIAEHRRVEEALHESQRSLATLLSNLPGMA